MEMSSAFIFPRYIRGKGIIRIKKIHAINDVYAVRTVWLNDEACLLILTCLLELHGASLE